MMQDTCTVGTYISTICQPAATFVAVLYYAENDSRVILVAQVRKLMMPQIKVFLTRYSFSSRYCSLKADELGRKCYVIIMVKENILSRIKSLCTLLSF